MARAASRSPKMDEDMNLFPRGDLQGGQNRKASVARGAHDGGDVG
jgi:hypothetical protein